MRFFTIYQGAGHSVRLVEELKNHGHEIVIVSTGHTGENGFYEVPGFAPPGVKESVETMQFLFGRGRKSVYRKAFMDVDLLYLNTADMYLHASVVELESLSCLEAIGCGLPCLIGDSPNSAAPMFAHDENFIFEMDHPADLAARIDYWYENRERLKDLKKETLFLAERFRFDHCVDEMEPFYRDIVTEGGKSTGNLVPGIKAPGMCDERSA